MTEDDKDVVDLHPSEWNRKGHKPAKKAREPFNWSQFIALFFILSGLYIAKHGNPFW